MLGLDLVSGWIVVMHMYLRYFMLSYVTQDLDRGGYWRKAGAMSEILAFGLDIWRQRLMGVTFENCHKNCILVNCYAFIKTVII